MKKIFLFASLFAVLFACSCSGVTETGNPYITPRPPEAVGEGPSEPSMLPLEKVYTNQQFGVSIKYPDGWSYSGETSNSVVFADGESSQSAAKFTFSSFPQGAAALPGYLSSSYKGIQFLPYTAGTLNGYVWDDPSFGTGGADRKAYFFAGNTTLVKVESEIFAAAKEGFETLLAGMSFTADSGN